MEFIQAGAVVASDFSFTHDCGSRIQQQFYVLGLLRARQQLLGEPGILGREHRRGIVLIPRADFDRFRAALCEEVLRNPLFCYSHALRLRQLYVDMATACDVFERTAAQPFLGSAEAMLNALIKAISYNVLYHLYPEKEVKDWLVSLVEDQELAERTYVALHYSDVPPHYFRVNLGLLDLVEEWLRTREMEGAGRFIDELAFAFDFYIDENELEQSEPLERYVQELAATFNNDPEAVCRERRRIELGRLQQKQQYDEAWEAVHSALSRKGTKPSEATVLMAALGLRQTLATEEEERHFLQMRVQRNCRRILDRCGLSRTESDIEGMLAACEAGKGVHVDRAV